MSKSKFPDKYRFKASLQRGFALTELIIAISITAVLAIYAASKLAKDSEEDIAQSAGVYISTVSAGLERHILTNFAELSTGAPVPGTAVALRPTPAEIAALGRLPAGFPVGPGAVPTRQDLRLDITTANCPGPNCTITGTACTTTPVNLGGAVTRFDLASTMMTAQNGRGGQSVFGDGATIRGPNINVPNPLGNVEGVVCGSTIVDTGFFQQFVRIQDTRDPDLQGPLTVAGATTLNGPTTVNNNATVNGELQAAGDTTVGTCARILATTGRAGFGCANPDDVPAGYTGGVRSADVVASGRVLASDAPAAFTGNNGNYAFMGVEAGVAEIRTSGRAAADRLTPLGVYAPGAACAPGDEGSIARAPTGGVVVCSNSSWRALSISATAGDACTVEGSQAVGGAGNSLLCVGGTYVGMDTIIRSGTPNDICTNVGATYIDKAANNEALICRFNPAGGTSRLMRLKDLTANLTFVSANEVTDGTVIAKPTCSGTGTPVIQLIGKTYASPDGGVDIYALSDQPAVGQWTARLRNGAGAPLLGNPVPVAIAQVFCYFP